MLSYEAFCWYVQPGAYRWEPAPGIRDEDDEPTPPGISVGAWDPGRAGQLRRYAPLRDQTGLFLLFAETPPTPQGILGFASRFGLLYSARTTQRPRRSRPRRGGEEVVEVLAEHYEPHESWASEILTMRLAVDVWRWLEAGDSARLARHLRWHGRPGEPATVEVVSDPDLPDDAPHEPLRQGIRFVVSVSPERVEAVGRVRPEEPEVPCLLWLELLLAEMLAGRLSTRFVLAGPGERRLAVLPGRLVDAMWLQFGQAVCQHKRYRRCSVCQDWFELSPEVARTNRLFCGVGCKNRAYRSRLGKARELYLAGKAVEEIARELDSDPATIRRWITGVKK
jgi:hypothetical protein